jgi:hypothetical protein
MSSYPHMKTATDTVSEALFFLVFRIPDDGQNPQTQRFWVSHHRQNPLVFQWLRVSGRWTKSSNPAILNVIPSSEPFMFYWSQTNRTEDRPIKNKQTNSLALSPRASYTDWSTATCRRNLVSTFVDRGVSRGQKTGQSLKQMFLPFRYVFPMKCFELKT